MTKWVLTAGLALLAGSVAAQGGPGAAELQACDAAAKKAQWDTVIASCEKALEVMGEEHVGARYYLGWGYRGKKNYAKGIENFKKFMALAKDRDDVQADQLGHANRGVGLMLYEQKKYAEALPYLEKVLASNRNDKQIQWSIASSAMQLKNDTKAAKHLAEVIRLDPRMDAAYYYSGMIALRAQDNQKARTDLEKFLELKPSDRRSGTVHGLLCPLAYNAEDHAAAKSHCEKFMASNPEPGTQTDTAKQILDVLNKSS
jgi:tetratricopeptide (TPR) repeat protein